MQQYKKKIYSLWAKCNPETFPYPTDKLIKKKVNYYKNFIIKKFFPQNKNIKILDLGCSYGLFLQTCQISGYKNIFGVEISQECIEFAQTKFKIKTITCAEIIGYLKVQPNESVNIITAFEVVEHFEKKEVLDLFQLIYQKLRHGGVFIMRVPNAGNLQGLYFFYSDLTHESPFTDMLIKELFHLVHFENTKIISVHLSKFRYMISEFIRQTYSLVHPFYKNKFSLSTNLLAVGYKK